MCLEIGNQGGHGLVEFLDEEMLLQLAVIVSVPAGAIHEIHVV